MTAIVAFHYNLQNGYLVFPGDNQDRITGGQLPRAPRDSNKILVRKIFVIQKRYKNTTLYYIPMLR